MQSPDSARPFDSDGSTPDQPVSLIPTLKSRAEYHLTMFQVCLEAVEALSSGRHETAHKLLHAMDRLAFDS